MKTREGNPVYPSTSPFRAQNPIITRLYQSKDLCLSCKHLGDLCGKQERVFEKRVRSKIKPVDILTHKEDGIARSWVSECDGFEEHYSETGYAQERAQVDINRGD